MDNHWYVSTLSYTSANGNFFSAPHFTSSSCHDLLKAFWESEESKPANILFIPEEAEAVQHCKPTHELLPEGYFRVQLPEREDVTQLGESREQAIQRFLYNEGSLMKKSA